MVRTDEYFAGLFDGEGHIGCIAIGKNNPNKNLRYQIRISVNGAYKPMMESIQKHFNVGYIGAHQRKNNGKQTWRWYVQKNEHVLEVLERILPYLQEKKSQAEVAILGCNKKLDKSFVYNKLQELKKFNYQNI